MECCFRAAYHNDIPILYRYDIPYRYAAPETSATDTDRNRISLSAHVDSEPGRPERLSHSNDRNRQNNDGIKQQGIPASKKEEC